LILLVLLELKVPESQEKMVEKFLDLRQKETPHPGRGGRLRKVVWNDQKYDDPCSRVKR
jgi:hypothetical protein